MSSEANSPETIFTVAARHYVGTAARRTLAMWWWLAALVLGALAIAGTFNSRYIYLCLMVLFIVYPMLLSFTWLALAARPAMSWCMRPQHIESAPEGALRLCFHAYPAPESDEAAGEVLGSLEISAVELENSERHGAHTLTELHRPNEFGIKFVILPGDALNALSPSNQTA